MSSDSEIEVDFSDPVDETDRVQKMNLETQTDDDLEIVLFDDLEDLTTDSLKDKNNSKASTSEMKEAKSAMNEFSNDPIVINAELDPSPVDNMSLEEHIARTPSDLFKDRPSFDPIESTIRCESGHAFVHRNYMHYLTIAWSNHLSVVISPDIVFYTVLCELASSIKADPDTYRHLFTTSTDQVEIMAITTAPDVIDLDQLVYGIKQNTPIDATLFTAEFSSSTRESRLALQAAFCEAMSPYYYYTRSACGIPRVKILGNEQDWLVLEQKIHALATDVFAHDIDMEKSLASYLQRVETVVRRIRSDRDPQFWKQIFEIGGCYSGHTHMVTGWVTLLYKNGYGDIYQSHKWTGTDYYNYDSHISTVDWQCLETDRKFQLRTGLLYSVINKGSDELDAKFPWFEPQFAHVVFDAKIKMNPEQYEDYINIVLRGNDRHLFKTFFEVLKDDPIIIDKGRGELKQRLTIAKRQLDYWKKNSGKLEQLDLHIGDLGDLLDWNEERKKNAPVIEQFMPVLFDFFTHSDINEVVLPQWSSSICAAYEKEILGIFTGKVSLEKLTASGSDEFSPGSVEALCDLLIHPQCNIKTLRVLGDRLTPENLAKIAAALVETKSKFEVLEFNTVNTIALADAIYRLATERGLKSFSVKYPTTTYYNAEDLEQMPVMQKLFDAIADSKTLETIYLHDFGKKYINSFRTEHIDKKDLFEKIATNLPLNTNLISLAVDNWQYGDELLNKLLKISSLKQLTLIKCPELMSLEFLQTTKNLESICGEISFTNDSAEYLAQSLSEKTCKISSLNLRRSSFAACALTRVTNSFMNNNSLRLLNLEDITIDDVDSSFMNDIAFALIKQNSLTKINLSHIKSAKLTPIHIEKFLQRISTNQTLRSLRCDVGVGSDSGLDLVMKLLKNNTALKTLDLDYFGFNGDKSDPFSEEKRKELLEVARERKMKKFGVNGIRLS